MMFNAELNCFKTNSEAPAPQDKYVFFFQKYLKLLTIFFHLFHTKISKVLWENIQRIIAKERKEILLQIQRQEL